jgi:hypothetical protein
LGCPDCRVSPILPEYSVTNQPDLYRPAGDPKSAGRGAAALAAADLWEELELVDERGLPASGRVIWLLEMRPNPTPYYWVVVSFERARAPVPGWLRPRGRRRRGLQSARGLTWR